MMKRVIPEFFRPPVFENDEAKTRSARILNHVQIGMWVLLFLYSVIDLPFITQRKTAGALFALVIAAVLFISRFLMKRGDVRRGGAFLVYALWILFGTVIVLGSGLKDMYFTFLISLSVVAGLLLGRHATLLTAAMTVIMGLIILCLENLGYLPLNFFPNPPAARWVQLAFALTLMATTFNLAVRSLEDSLAFARTQLDERTKAEDALRRSEERFRLLAENARDIIWTMDMDLHFTYMSPYTERVVGCKPVEYMARPLHEVLTPSCLNAVRKLFEEELEIERKPEKDLLRSRTIEMDLIDHKGRAIPAETKLTFIRDAAGRAVGILGSTRDISERKGSEKALKDNEAQYRALIETTDTGYVIINTKGEVLDANEEYFRLTGHSHLEEILGRTVIEWTADHEKAKNMEAVRKCMEKGYIRNLEIDYVDPDGHITPVEVNATVMEKGGTTRILSLCRDITERRRAEEERHELQERLRRAEKMEALGLLAGGVAHDLNNVLGILIGYSELLLLQTPEDSPLRQHASGILAGGQRAAAIIQDLLTLARRGVAVSETISLNRVVSDFLASPEYQKLSSYHPGMTLKTEMEPRLQNIKGSPVHLRKTLMNLVSNAAEALTGCGVVTIRTENRYLERPIPGYANTKEGEYDVLTISDTGMGIRPEELGRIFEPFYTKKVMGRSGTGLGLAVVWGTVKDHEGYIDVQSEEGKGTTFVLYFPATREAVREDVDDAVPREKYLGRGERILVVDDVEGQRLMAESMLKGLGYEVEVAGSGEEAVEYVKRQAVGLLILDMIMAPGIDGLETFRRIREFRPHQRAVIVSGFSETDRVREAQQLGAGAYVRKPYLLEKIGLAVRQELDRGKEQDGSA